jgi:crossover junction endodeoxyribonuclease RuvC
MRLGIDPGITGAIALVSGRLVIECWDMPVYKYEVLRKGKTPGQRRSVDSYKLFNLLIAVKERAGDHELHVVVERQQPNMGTNTDSPLTAGTVMFNYGKMITCLELIFGRDELKIVHPLSWKSAAGLIKTSKNDAIEYCKDNFDTGDLITLKKHSGRADAVLIAYYGL